MQSTAIHYTQQPQQQQQHIQQSTITTRTQQQQQSIQLPTLQIKYINSILVEQLYNNIIQSIYRLYSNTSINKNNINYIDKLDSIGYNTGIQLAQHYLQYHNNNIIQSSESLDKIKYLCKELWLFIYNKTIDKLQTNYKGIYVLHDFNHKLTSHLQYGIQQHYVNNNNNNNDDILHNHAISNKIDTALYTTFISSSIRGICYILNINVNVKCDLSKWPNVLFTIIDIDTTQRLSNTSAVASSNLSTSSSTTSVHTSPVKPTANDPLTATSQSQSQSHSTSVPNIAALRIAPPPLMSQSQQSLQSQHNQPINAAAAPQQAPQPIVQAQFSINTQGGINSLISPPAVTESISSFTYNNNENYNTQTQTQTQPHLQQQYDAQAQPTVDYNNSTTDAATDPSTANTHQSPLLNYYQLNVTADDNVNATTSQPSDNSQPLNRQHGNNTS